MSCVPIEWCGGTAGKIVGTAEREVAITCEDADQAGATKLDIYVVILASLALLTSLWKQVYIKQSLLMDNKKG